MEERRQSVLIIDDDKFFLEFYRAELSQHGLFVEIASDGEEGLEKALKDKPDIIMLDIILPKKDGFEVLTELKKNEGTKNVPVIITSTSGDNADSEKLLGLGAIKIFNKTLVLPKDVALYIDSVLKNGGKPLQNEAGVSKENINSMSVQISEEKAKQVFAEALKQVEKSMSYLFNDKIKCEKSAVEFRSFPELEKEINSLAEEAGTIEIFSEIEAKKEGIVFLSLRRDDMLTLIKAVEGGFIGHSLAEAHSSKVAETFFNIILTAFLDKISQTLPSRMVSKTPKEASAQEVSSIAGKMFASQGNGTILDIYADYFIESPAIKLKFVAVFNAEILSN